MTQPEPPKSYQKCKLREIGNITDAVGASIFVGCAKQRVRILR